MKEPTEEDSTIFDVIDAVMSHRLTVRYTLHVGTGNEDVREVSVTVRDFVFSIAVLGILL